ncbi:hypothetical protein DUT91_13120 [Phyllobacterium salinisoli]|uniref:Uncharacterized protein n=1 Tax=Phyllobacterium salinisoli TaxID=1899321 RepID=A0A368K1I2_9HYPH|nr:hypothetical protein DUT91_13120 [Phyllobacterium salinisoli]
MSDETGGDQQRKGPVLEGLGEASACEGQVHLQQDTQEVSMQKISILTLYFSNYFTNARRRAKWVGA